MSTRPDLHDNDQIHTYAAGMNASSDDKAKILNLVHAPMGDYVPRIAELGCGEGTVLKLLADKFPYAEIDGYDLSGRLLNMAASRDYGQTKVNLIRQDLLTESLRKDYDTIICCSFLHEIYSEIVRNQGDLDMMDWFGQLLPRLKPGGRLIIRDGVKPEPENLKVRFLAKPFKGVSVEDLWGRFVDDFELRHIGFQFDSTSKQYTIKSHDMFEFLTKFFYLQNWAIEMKEVFGWTTVNKLPDLVGRNMELIHSEIYTLPYLKNEIWNERIEMVGASGKPYDMKSTMLMTFQKKTP